MKQPRVATIRSRLSLLVLVCLVPAFAVAALLITHNFQNERERLTQDSMARTRAIKASVDRELASVQAALTALATSPHLTANDLPGFYGQAKEVLKEVNSTNLLLTDANTQQVLNTRIPFGAPLPLHGNPELSRRVFETGRPVVSDLFLGRVSRLPLVTIAVPVQRQGRVVYELTASISPQSLSKVLAQQHLPGDWIGVIVDSAGTVVARTHQIEQTLGKKASASLLRAMAVQAEGIVESRTLEDIPVVTAFSRSAQSGWTVAIGIPKSQLTEALWRTVAVASGAAVLLVLAGLGAAWLVGRHIAISVRALVAPALALGSGRPAEIGPLYFREASDVGEAIVAASQTLREAGAAVAASEARLRGILESAMDAIITIDEGQNVVLFNAAAQRLFGCAPEEALGRPLAQFVPERFRERHEQHIHQFGRDGVTRRRMGQEGGILGLRKNGEEFPIEASISQVEEQGRRFYTVILRDVTARVLAQQALERSNADLQQFAYVASHDLKGPLRSINGFVQLLERVYASRLDAKGIDLLRRTSTAATRLEQLTNDLLLLAQVDGEAPAFGPVDCQEAMQEVFQLLQAPIESVGATVSAEGLPTVLGDRIQLVRLFLNLVSNAIKYKGERPLVIRATAERAGSHWTISVADNGMGIAPVHFERIFEIFNRLHTGARHEGSGIGLAICRRIVQRHGGTIWVESAEGLGSTFKVALAAMDIRNES